MVNFHLKSDIIVLIYFIGGNKMFKSIDIKELKESAAELFDNRWALLTAGNKDAYNMMTVSWGMMGELWNKEVCAVFVRPQRYTFEFTEKGEYFTLSILPEEMKKSVHSICGSKSGRDIDKVKETGITPYVDGDYVAYEEAEIIICCKKLYAQKMEESCFVDKSLIEKNYSLRDWHTMYICEIEKVLVKE